MTPLEAFCVGALVMLMTICGTTVSLSARRLGLLGFAAAIFLYVLWAGLTAAALARWLQ